MTEKDKWYENRILWKANKNYLFDYKCKRFKDLDKDHKDCIKKIIPKNEIPVIIFFEKCDKWTVMCTQSICSYYDETLYYVNKSDFAQKITPHISMNDIPLANSLEKKDAIWLKMNETKEYIWFPSSNDLWNFWGIIKMMAELK